MAEHDPKPDTGDEEAELDALAAAFDYPDDALTMTLKRWKKGEIEPERIRALLGQTHDQLLCAGCPAGVSPDGFAILLAAVQDIAEGRVNGKREFDANKALRLKRVGKPPNRQRNAEIAWAVHKLRRNGATEDAAIAAVADEINKSTSNVRRIYRAIRSDFGRRQD